MKILEQIGKLSDIGKSTEELQKELTTLEAGHIWNKLTVRYDIIEQTKVLLDFTKDKDLKNVVQKHLENVSHQAKELEELARKYGLPLPVRPPADANSVTNVEAISDNYIFKRVFQGIESFLPIHMIAFQQSTSAKLRERFMEFLMFEMEMYDEIFEFGKSKGWVDNPPAYRV